MCLVIEQRFILCPSLSLSLSSLQFQWLVCGTGKKCAVLQVTEDSDAFSDNVAPGHEVTSDTAQIVPHLCVLTSGHVELTKIFYSLNSFKFLPHFYKPS